MKRNLKISYILSILFFFFGFARAESFLLHTPILAYANNFDPSRMQTCYGIWSEDQLKFSYPFRAISSTPNRYYYVTGWTQPESCYISSVLILDFPIIYTHDLLYHEYPLDIRWVGSFKLLILSIIFILFYFYFGNIKYKYVQFYLSICYFIIVSDPFINLYGNSFYRHYGIIIFLSLSLLSSFVLMNKIDNKYIWILWNLSVVLLATSANQNRYISIIFIIMLFIFGSRKYLSRKILSSIFLFSGILFIAWIDSGRAEYQERSTRNNYNVYHDVILPHASIPSDTLKRAHLPLKCLAILEVTSKSNAVAICPEINTLTKADILISLLRDPAIIYRAIDTMLNDPQSFELISDGPGQVEGKDYGRIDDIDIFTINNIVTYISNQVKFKYIAIISLAVLCFILYYQFSLNGIKAFLIIILILMYYIFSTIFGDGYDSLRRHLVPFNFLIVSIIVYNVFYLIHSLSMRVLSLSTCSKHSAYTGQAN